MALNIPNVGDNGTGFLQGAATGSDIMQRMLMNPYDMALKRAQAQNQAASAQESTMLLQLMQGSTPNATGTGTSGGVPEKMDVNKALFLSGKLKLPTQVVNGQIITPFGSFRVGETKSQERAGETHEKNAQDILKTTAESAIGGLSVNASFQALDKIMEDPNYKNIAGTIEGKTITAQPFGIPVGSMLQQAFPGKFTPEDAQLAGQASTHMGNIITGVAAKFKGPFKQMINGIINNMKPNMGDSIAVQQSKIKSLRQLSDLADTQNDLIAKYVNEGMDPTAAIIRVAHETNFSDIISSYQGKNNNTNPTPKTNNQGQVILYKKGKEYHVPPKMMKQALSEGFTIGY